MRLLLQLPLITVLLILAFPSAAEPLVTLCYHDVRDDVNSDMDTDQFAVSTYNLVQHFEWLRQNGYQPVTVDAVMAAREGGPTLPEKPVLLTFDDGYVSFHDKIFPLLKLYKYPAVIALVVDWLEQPAGDTVPYGKTSRPRSDFLSWGQIRMMQESGLVEIASHSHNSHRGILANPQGNTQAALVTRHFNGDQYETEADFRRRVGADLSTSATIINQRTGRSPSTMVWPYGRYNAISKSLAQQAGMNRFLTLDEASKNSANDDINRILISANPDQAQFKALFESPHTKPAERLVHIDLDYLYDDDPEQLNRNLSQLLDRVKKLRINTVYLQAFADPDGDGNADALYFPNRHLPVRADLFNRVAWQLATRTDVKVYAWMPVSAFTLAQPQPEWMVWAWQDGQIIPSTHNYQRLSVFHPKARKFISDIYQDLASHASFYGLLFHDDALLTDFEDLNPAAIDYYRQHGFPDFDWPTVRADNNAQWRWSRLKSEALANFTDELAATVRAYQPSLKTARNLYALPLLDPSSEAWFAQSVAVFTKHYDYIAIMAMPYMENAPEPRKWLTSLVAAAKQQVGLEKVVFELQSRDWRNGQAINSQELAAQMELLRHAGALNFGYYPDDFLRNQPDLATIKAQLSLEDYPHRRR